MPEPIIQLVAGSTEAGIAASHSPQAAMAAMLCAAF